MSIRAGDYAHRITLQSPVIGDPNEFGDPPLTYEDAYTIWGSVRGLRGEELQIAKQLDERITHEIRFRYRPGPDASWRIIYQAKIFEIQSVIDVEEQHEETLCMCIATNKSAAARLALEGGSILQLEGASGFLLLEK
jgi:SPP1 family predicted phage head-tail adaptor